MTLPAATDVVECTTRSPDATHAIAAGLAPIAEAGDLLCLWGELGAGKTVFAKGFGHGLGVAGTISSPSFVLMAEYPGRTCTASRMRPTCSAVACSTSGRPTG